MNNNCKNCNAWERHDDTFNLCVNKGTVTGANNFCGDFLPVIAEQIKIVPIIQDIDDIRPHTKPRKPRAVK